jgi:xanthine permease XanP
MTTKSPSQTSDLIYHLEDRPPLPQAMFAAVQHLLAMFVAVITPALLIANALKLPAADTQHIISMSLFASGLASILQIRTWGPIGSGLLSIQGTSFNFVAPLIMGGTMLLQKHPGDIKTMMAALFGTLMLAALTEVFISRVLHLIRRVITPLVSGIVVMIIGLSLIKEGLVSIGGGYGAMADGSFGAPVNLLLGGIVLGTIVLLSRLNNPYLRVSSLIIAMAIGYLVAWGLGELKVRPESSEALMMVPTPLYYGLSIEWSLLLPLMLVFMITSLETIGDITATSDMSEQPVTGPLYMKRLKGGVLANGLNSMLSAVFNTFPNSCFGQNNSVIQITGVASRYVGYIVAAMLVLLGLFPFVSNFILTMPDAVLGGATLIMFGTIAAAGVRIISKETLNRRAIMILGLSLAVGLGISQEPKILQFAPEWVSNLFSSGIASGGITAIVLNLIMPIDKSDEQ